MPAVWCVVLAYNAVDLTLRLYRISAPAGLSAPGHSRRRQRFLRRDGGNRRALPDVGVLALSENLGYAGGNIWACAMPATGADLLFLVNNDTRFGSTASPSWLLR